MVNKLALPVEMLFEKIKSKEAVIGVIGLGYVGLPLALKIVEKGYQVIGFDINKEKIKQLSNGQSYIVDIPEISVKEAIKQEQFKPTSVFAKLSEVDVILICVPTPTTKDGKPNISHIIEAAGEIRKNMKDGTLIILESTTFPGTTENVVHPLLEKRNFVVGQNIFLGYSPERVDPGNLNFSLTNTPKVVGGVTEICLELVRFFYKRVLNTSVHAVKSPKVAEMEKLLENTFRQINIALVNELSQLCYKMDVDVWEVIEAASTKPYGFMPFTPGPGVGGHCIPVDPKYLIWAGQQHGFSAKLIEVADKINENMPSFVVERLENYLNLHGNGLRDADILIIGATYKPNINDFRESPAIQVIDRLLEKDCRVKIVDPYIETFKTDRKTIQTVALTTQLIEEADCALILTNHLNIDYSLIDQHASLIFDTRNTQHLFENKKYYKL